jgi:hypothetical protein
MKRKIFGLSALVVLCASSAAFADDRSRVFQTADIQPAGPEIAAEGAAWLKRSKNRVEGRVMAKVDKANTPYSIWWVVFNNPDGCIDGCDIGDVLNGGIAADAAIFNASGAISAASGDSGGVINVDISAIGRESAGNGSQVSGFGDFFPFLNEFRKNNGLCAEIHVDINEHDFDGDWVQELTYPENPQAFAVFPPVGKCSDHHDDDDD